MSLGPVMADVSKKSGSDLNGTNGTMALPGIQAEIFE